MNAVDPTADVERVLTPAETGSPSTAAPPPPPIDQDTYLATRGITAGVLLGAALWVVILTVAWLIFG